MMYGQKVKCCSWLQKFIIIDLWWLALLLNQHSLSVFDSQLVIILQENHRKHMGCNEVMIANVYVCMKPPN